jgi:hypothetical protein
MRLLKGTQWAQNRGRERVMFGRSMCTVCTWTLEHPERVFDAGNKKPRDVSIIVMINRTLVVWLRKRTPRLLLIKFLPTFKQAPVAAMGIRHAKMGRM